MPGAPLPLVASLVIAYLAGSIPFAYLAGRLRGIDLRQHGSGNLGATNVVRVLGPKIGAAVFAADILKGFLPVHYLPRVTDTAYPEHVALGIAVAAIVGHVRPIFLLWRGGGKGVATAAGAFLGLAPVATLVAFVLWLAVFALSRYVSLASITAAIALPIALLVTGHALVDPVVLTAVAVVLFVLYTHRTNVGRLRRGEEHRFVRKQGSKQPGAPAPDRTSRAQGT